MVPGVRVVLDARPLQTPDRSPLGAHLPCRDLLGAFDEAPLTGESFAFLIAFDDDRRSRPSPTATSSVVGRRQLHLTDPGCFDPAR